ncbi:hypothetical protein ABIC88_001602 [Pseudomonas kilonensis]|jgi:hypothetical protein
MFDTKVATIVRNDLKTWQRPWKKLRRVYCFTRDRVEVQSRS